jgi:hypothetical protein
MIKFGHVLPFKPEGACPDIGDTDPLRPQDLGVGGLRFNATGKVVRQPSVGLWKLQ